MRGRGTWTVAACLLAGAVAGCGSGDDPEEPPPSAGARTQVSSAARSPVTVGAATDAALPRAPADVRRILADMKAGPAVRAIAVSRSEVYLAARRGRPGTVCAAVSLRGQGGYGSGCWPPTAIAEGYAFTASGNLVAGIVPDGVRRVTVTGLDGRDDTVRAENNAYVGRVDYQPKRIRWTAPSTGPVDFRVP